MLWGFTKLKGGFPVERYRRLAIFQNHLHSPKYYISMTSFDEVNNVSKEYDRLCAKTNNVGNTVIARTYFGHDKVSRTVKMHALRAMRVHRTTLHTLGTIMNSEHPGQCQSQPISSTKSGAVLCSAGNDRDFSVYREFVKLHSLYNCSPFIKAKADNDIEAQVKTLHIVKEVCKCNSFHTVQ